MLKINRKEVKKQLNNIVIMFDKISNNKKPTKLSKKITNEKQDSLQEIINHLRICVKYMLFDNESLCRENKVLKQDVKYLKKILKDNGIEI